MTGPVTRCQSCDSPDLEQVLSLGDLPAANQYFPIGYRGESKRYPHDLLHCQKCELVQLGYVAPYQETFPVDYPYTSGTTRALRENFADLAREVKELRDLKPTDFVLDIGGNDGTLLSNFDCFRLNVTPENAGKIGAEKGIPHWPAYWGKQAAAAAVAMYGKAKVVTATNVFAHVPDPNEFLGAVLDVLAPDGVLVLECQELDALLGGVQYDHLYTEHLRFFSLSSLATLMWRHGFYLAAEVRRTPIHGGSLRSFWSPRKSARRAFVNDGLDAHRATFASRVAESKADLWSLLSSNYGATFAGIGAPSRASTLINYVGIDHNVCPYICETEGSAKLGKYMPGTIIPIVPEDAAALDVDYLLLFAHHIAADLMPAIRAKGFKGKFIKPLPRPEVFG